jgi:magnesium transporter
MKGTLTQAGGTTAAATQEAIGQAVAGGQFFWLDLDIHGAEPGDDVPALLTHTFHFHPVAVEAADKFGQRARIDEYDGFVHIIAFGMADDGKHVAEVHCFVTGTAIVTLHHGNCPALAGVRERLASHHSAVVVPPQVAVAYLIMDTLADSFFPVLSDLDDSIDTLETAILRTPTEEQLGTLFEMKRLILTIRKVVAPQRDMIDSLNTGMVTIPGTTEADTAYFRNLYDHLIRISDMVDGYRDLVSGAMDTHLSMVSNRLNVIMKQLAMIATFFLPLSFLTGFFGQNFAYLTGHLQVSLGAFIGLGIGLELVAIAALVWLFHRRGWLGSGPTA